MRARPVSVHVVLARLEVQSRILVVLKVVENTALVDLSRCGSVLLVNGDKPTIVVAAGIAPVQPDHEGVAVAPGNAEVVPHELAVVRLCLTLQERVRRDAGLGRGGLLGVEKVLLGDALDVLLGVGRLRCRLFKGHVAAEGVQLSDKLAIRRLFHGRKAAVAGLSSTRRNRKAKRA